MSAPTSGSADSSSIAGFYPDPSIPGYIRYWNGAAWVPGTSRPAPAEGEAMPAAPPGVTTAQPAPVTHEPIGGATQMTGMVPDETGPMFLDQPSVAADAAGAGAPPQLRQRGEMDLREAGGGAADGGAPGQEGGAAPRDVRAVPPQPAAWGAPQGPLGAHPEPASAWQADVSRQAGFGGDQDRRVSWGAAPGAPGAPGGSATPAVDPRLAPAAGARTPSGEGEGAPDRALPAARQSPALPPTGAVPAQGSGPASESGAARGEGTLTFRRSGTGATDGPQGGGASAGVPRDRGTVTIRATQRGTARQDAATPAAQAAPPASAAAAQAAPAASAGAMQSSAPATTPASAQVATPPAAAAPAPAGAPPASTPGAQPPAGAAPQAQGAPAQQGWVHQVHQLAQQGAPAAPAPAAGGGPGAPEGVIPWKPPVEDPFRQAAQAQGRPAGLGRRLMARLIDTIVLLGAAAAAAVPLWGKAMDHIDEKVEEAKQTGETVTVYLLDGTTGGYLAIVVGVLLVVGLLYEALPTAKWGRTLGKKLCGLRVLDIEQHDTPGFGAALRRWLVYGVLGLLVIGVLNVLWCLFDRPWRQCWHDKAARTFVASRD
ncbi:RDD family protein [Streptomyces sp. LX-29]|uniref:RDD family protein n=1 Tax=Streptomyces sp. LX-29 TaxID=2900152 RepID=UPI00240E92FA|nr:RDD family protein [Streptomyces sp. LX-29]WFB09251.1 RDD family protein [Streptomyces sp. LX-29]